LSLACTGGPLTWIRVRSVGTNGVDDYLVALFEIVA